ncbi:hypothetical protein, partial [Pseudomonas aeruginosa]|uniref:hypothetical protein n=1 Tax=Pseudomonas aeruginosa TaxID=287 RepID=UPI001BB08FC4
MHGEIDEDRTNIVDSQRQLSIELARLYFFATIGKTRYPTKVFYIFCKNSPNGQEGKKKVLRGILGKSELTVREAG